MPRPNRLSHGVVTPTIRKSVFSAIRTTRSKRPGTSGSGDISGQRRRYRDLEHFLPKIDVRQCPTSAKRRIWCCKRCSKGYSVKIINFYFMEHGPKMHVEHGASEKRVFFGPLCSSVQKRHLEAEFGHE